MFEDNERLMGENEGLGEEIEVLKGMVVEGEERREVFEEERIREVQRMREECEMKMMEASTKLLRQA